MPPSCLTIVPSGMLFLHKFYRFYQSSTASCFYDVLLCFLHTHLRESQRGIYDRQAEGYPSSMRCSDRLYSPVSVLFCGVLFPPVQCTLYLNTVHTIHPCFVYTLLLRSSMPVYNKIPVCPSVPSQKKKTPGTNNSRRPYQKGKTFMKKITLTTCLHNTTLLFNCQCSLTHIQ